MAMLKGCNLLCVVSIMREKIASGAIQFHALRRDAHMEIAKEAKYEPICSRTRTLNACAHMERALGLRMNYLNYLNYLYVGL